MSIDINNKKCLVLLSGGIDSSTAAYFMKDSGYSVDCLFMDYKRKSRSNELHSASYIVNKINCLLHVICDPLDQQYFIDARPFEVPLNQSTVRKQESGIDIMLCLTHWLLIASSYSIYLDIPYIVLGVTASDCQRLPKVDWAYVDKITAIVNNWTGKGPEILLPFLSYSKQKVITIGKELGVPLGNTWSCLEQGVIHCGQCDGCTLRRRSFSDSGFMDSISYKQ